MIKMLSETDYGNNNFPSENNTGDKEEVEEVTNARWKDFTCMITSAYDKLLNVFKIDNLHPENTMLIFKYEMPSLITDILL